MSTFVQSAAALAVRIRPYSSADAAATREVFSRAVRITAGSRYTPEQRTAWAAGGGSVHRWNADRTAHHTLVAVAADSGADDESQKGLMAVADPGVASPTPVEHVVGYVDFRDSGYVDHLFVDPDHGRQGIATRLLAAAIASARDHGAAELTSHVSLVAIPVFERQGFAVVHYEQVMLRGQHFDRALMRLDLKG